MVVLMLGIGDRGGDRARECAEPHDASFKNGVVFHLVRV